MNKKTIFLIFVSVFLTQCTPKPPAQISKQEPPRIILHPKPLGNGGIVTRDLFRSFWILPGQDSDELRVGIIPSAQSIRIRSPHHFTIRVYGEHESYDIASPGGVIWEFEFDSIVRPPVLRYLVTVGDASIQDPRNLPSATLQKWKDLGFAQAQWIGPPKMDAWKDNGELKRYFVTLAIEQDRSKAENFCKLNVSKKHFKPCKVITRMDLPHLARGKFRAVSSNFEKEFEGVIEIISKRDAIEVFGVKTSMLSENRETLKYRSSLFVVPNLENELSLVQSTSLDEYLKSVVPSEIFPEAPLEALKAQAVIARTYAFQSKDHYSDKPFLTCASTECQVYLGEKTKNASRGIGKAVDQTRDMVLKEPSGFFAETFYHGSSGGKTDMKQWLLGGAPKPYLVGANDILGDRNIDLKKNENVTQFLRTHPDTFCSISRFAKTINWTYKFDQQELNAILKKTQLTPPLKGIEVLQRGLSGRAVALRLKTANGNKVINGELQIRSLFNSLPSSLAIFEPQMSGGNITALTVIGRGSGHGVGLSQMGAIGRALEGQDYEEILQSYYPGTLLTSIDH